MMKRFASHYLLIPAVGFVKQQVVEISDEGVAQNIFPLNEEVESVEWLPGLIVLLSVHQMEEIKNTGMVVKNIPVFQQNLPVLIVASSCTLNDFLDTSRKNGEILFPYLFYPFDFTSMRPVDGTRHRLLR